MFTKILNEFSGFLKELFTDTTKFRTEDGRLIEISSKHIRVCMEDEQTQKIVRDSIKKFYDNYTIKR